MCTFFHSTEEGYVSSTEIDAKRKNPLAAVLSIFAPVRQQESLTAFLLMLDLFILLTAYYIIKPVREALILGGPGAEVKAYAGAAEAVLFWMMLPLYSAFAGRANRLRLINGITAFFMSHLLIFYLLGRIGLHFGVAFFLWVGLFNLMMVAQFWSLANDIYTPAQGRRLFAIVGVGGSLGGIFGSAMAGWLFKPLGPYSMMLVAAGLLAICLVLTRWIHRRESDGNPERAQMAAQAIGSSGGFQLVLKHRYLLLIAVMVFIANLVNTTGEFILGKTVTQELQNPVAIGTFYAGFFFWVNVAGAALQMFSVLRIMKYFGIAPALLFLPLISLCSYSLFAFAPLLGLIRVAKIAENSTDYSIQNTVREALFLQTDRESKYKAKAAIDSFFWRAGDALAGLLVFAGTKLAFNTRSFAILNMAFVMVWLVVVVAIMSYRKEGTAARKDLRGAA
jgi:AAA family ATP:ADP antiporter